MEQELASHRLRVGTGRFFDGHAEKISFLVQWHDAAIRWHGWASKTLCDGLWSAKSQNLRILGGKTGRRSFKHKRAARAPIRDTLEHGLKRLLTDSYTQTLHQMALALCGATY